MQKTYEFLKSCGTYFLATAEGDQPRVRPMGTIHIYEGKLYLQTGKSKSMSQQMMANPKVELCGYKDGKWIRVAAEAVPDESLEAQTSLLEEYPELKAMYTPGDGNNIVYYLKNAVSTISSFTEPPYTEEF